VIVSVPTNTLAPIVSFTPKYTATLPPTETPIPSITPTASDTIPPEPPSDTPTLTPTASTIGTVNFTSPTANLRSGPGQQFGVIIGLKAGTRLIVLGTDTTKGWYNIRLEDGSREGWLASNLVTVSNAPTVPVLSTDDIIRRTQDAGAQTVVGTAGGTPGTPAAAHKPGVIGKNDVLAYCDSKTNGQPRKTLTAGSPVTIYWSWFAKTPEQLADHINYSNYEVLLDGQLLKDWRNYKTDVIKQQDGNYYVYWYLPVGIPLPGDHKVEYKLTWQQMISDGYKQYGPTSDEEVDTGGCVFTIK
jgi:uncharacterized protein YraI